MRLSTSLTKAGGTARDIEAVERARTGIFRALWGRSGRP